jgi:hypothetical protein
MTGQRRRPVKPRYLAHDRSRSHRLYFLLTCTVLALSAGGCATFWDEAFSRERDLNGYFKPPNPLVVIHDSTDGERRAKALASLREPKQTGGTDKDQEAYLQILTTAARTDRDPLCRLGAIQALGYFKDPRAARALEEVYKQPNPFTQDFNGMIRQQALRAIEKTGNPDSRQLLILVARQPAPAPDAPSTARRAEQDERLIAIRALGKYQQRDSIDTLVFVLETEKDGSLRDRAHQSLEQATGKNLPPDAQAWRSALAGQPTKMADQPGVIERVSGWFK